MRTLSRPGISPSQSAAASRTAFQTAGAPASIVTPCWLDLAQDLRAVDLAEHDLPRPQPAIVYGRPQLLQWNIGSVCM